MNVIIKYRITVGLFRVNRGDDSVVCSFFFFFEIGGYQISITGTALNAGTALLNTGHTYIRSLWNFKRTRSSLKELKNNKYQVRRRVCGRILSETYVTFQFSVFVSFIGISFSNLYLPTHHYEGRLENMYSSSMKLSLGIGENFLVQ